jgi:hypothetical protein
MLNKGLRDEESIRIDNALKRLLTIVFVPETLIEAEKDDIEKQLEKLGLNVSDIIDSNADELIQRLQNNKLDWNNFEQFADFLVNYSVINLEYQPHVLANAISIYNFIQKESKMFSFGIVNKIAAANK